MTINQKIFNVPRIKIPVMPIEYLDPEKSVARLDRFYKQVKASAKTVELELHRIKKDSGLMLYQLLQSNGIDCIFESDQVELIEDGDGILEQHRMEVKIPHIANSAQHRRVEDLVSGFAHDLREQLYAIDRISTQLERAGEDYRAAAVPMTMITDLAEPVARFNNLIFLGIRKNAAYAILVNLKRKSISDLYELESPTPEELLSPRAAEKAKAHSLLSPEGGSNIYRVENPCQELEPDYMIGFAIEGVYSEMLPKWNEAHAFKPKGLLARIIKK